MSDLDDLSNNQLLDRTSRWQRAADWRARWTRRITLPKIPACPDHFTAVLTLPAELLGLGRLATTLTAPAADRHLRIRCAPVAGAHAPVASLAYVDDRRARSDGLDAVPDPPSTIELSTAINIDSHPTFALLSLVTLIGRVIGRRDSPQPAQVSELADTVDRCAATSPTTDNPAKQLALALHERIPIFWGDDLAAPIAADWATRQHWYAERAAFGLSTSDLIAGPLLARFPRYWPNTAYFVHLQSPPTDALAAQISHILSRRRFPATALTAPASASGLVAALYWLEFGEWLALYSAYLNNVDPADRVPHTVLFSP